MSASQPIKMTSVPGPAENRRGKRLSVRGWASGLLLALRRRTGAHLLRPLLFAGVGFLAFLVDMIVLAGLVYGAHWSAAHARLVSIPAAASMAWLVNRHVTFADRRRPRLWPEWLQYLALSGFNVAVNYGIYRILVAPGMWGSVHPLLAVMPGAVAGLAVTYIGAVRLVFVSQRRRRSG